MHGDLYVLSKNNLKIDPEDLYKNNDLNDERLDYIKLNNRDINRIFEGFKAVMDLDNLTSNKVIFNKSYRDNFLSKNKSQIKNIFTEDYIYLVESKAIYSKMNLF